LAVTLVLVCPQPVLAATAAVLLYPAVAALRWRGQAWGRAAWPGVAAGAIPVLAALLSPSFVAVCPLGVSRILCVGVCVAGGLAAGIWIGMRSTRLGSGSRAFLLGAGALMALVGVPACGFAGAAGGLGLMLGAVAGAAPFALRPLRTPGA
ncbi:MAG TPA: hypothetical protein VF310_11080, partial [Vicinamibacteria bacterium]